jgi:hypothetical protein
MTRPALRIINHIPAPVSLRLTLDGCLLARLAIQERGGQLILQRGGDALEALVELHADTHHSVSPRLRLCAESSHLLILERQRPGSAPALDVIVERSSALHVVSAENATAHPALVKLHLPDLSFPIQLIVAPASCATLRLRAPLLLTAFSQGIASASLELASCLGLIELRQRPDLSLELQHATP